MRRGFMNESEVMHLINSVYSTLMFLRGGYCRGGVSFVQCVPLVEKSTQFGTVLLCILKPLVTPFQIHCCVKHDFVSMVHFSF